MFYWRFHFDNETPVNCLFTQWKWTYILDFGPWGWSALNMGFVGKWPSRMQEQWVLFKIGRAGNNFWAGPLFSANGRLPPPDSDSPKSSLEGFLWPVHISRWNGSFDRAFEIKWTEIANPKKSLTLPCGASPHLVNHSKNASPDVLVMDASFLQQNRSNLKLNIDSIWEGKCWKHYFQISSANALPVNGHPTIIAVDGPMIGENRRLMYYQPMDFPSWPIQISNHRMAIRL